MSAGTQAAEPGSSGRPIAADYAFFVLLACVLALVAGLGAMTFKQGLKTEATKAQAEALVAWLTQAREKRGSSDFQWPACATHSASGEGRPGHWADCSAALLSPDGPLGLMRNSFSGQPLQWLARCEMGNPSSPGQIVIEKVVPTPAGSAVPVVITPMAADDPLDKPVTLRVTICDRGGYPVRVGEAEF